MRLLITGGYGFIGSHIAERFYKEGHEVCILDDLSSGMKTNVECKHKFYELKVEDSRCEDVFITNSFDLVIHCSSSDIKKQAVANSAVPQQDLNGVVNILFCCKKYAIKHFMYLSSTDIYGSHDKQSISEEQSAQPVSMSGFNKLSAEQYINAWSVFNGISALCLRLSYVYGPVQSSAGRYDKVSALTEAFMKRILQGVKEDYIVDLIYVEDVVDAIYRAALSELAGTYNLSSNTGYSIVEVASCLSKVVQPNKDNLVIDTKIHDISCTYDSIKIKDTLDWAPLYAIEDGLRKTLDSYKSNQKTEPKMKHKRKSKIFTNLRPYLPFIENVLLMLLVIAISLLFKNIYNSNEMVILLLYISLMGVAYGSRQSILSIVFSLGMFFYYGVSNGENIMTILYDPLKILGISALIFAGILIGFSIDKKELSTKQNEERLALLNEKYAFLQEISKENILIKSSLQNQITNSQESFGKVFSIIKELDVLDPDKILLSAVKIIEELMKNNDVAIYSVASDKARLSLVAASNIELFPHPQSQLVKKDDSFSCVIENGEIFTNAQMAKDMPFMIAPITYRQETRWLIILYQPEFEYITLHYKNMLSIVSDLISTSLTKAIDFNAKANENIYIENTLIMKEGSFRKLLESKINEYKKYSIPYTILKTDNVDIIKNAEYSMSLFNHLRDTDVVGLLGNELYLVLSNTNNINSSKILLRLENFGLQLATEKGLFYE